MVQSEERQNVDRCHSFVVYKETKQGWGDGSFGSALAQEVPSFGFDPWYAWAHKHCQVWPGSATMKEKRKAREQANCNKRHPKKEQKTRRLSGQQTV